MAEPDEDQLYYRIADDRLKGAIAARVTEAELVRRYPELARPRRRGVVQDGA